MTDINASLLSQTVKSDAPQTETSLGVQSGEASPQMHGQVSATTAPSQADQALEVERKRYRDLQSWMQKQINDLKAQLVQAQNTQVVTPSNAEEAQQLVTSNPEIAALINNMVAEKVDAHIQSNDQTTATMQADLKKLNAERAKTRLESAHPDVGTIMSEPLFAEWVNSVSATTRQALGDYVTYTDEAIEALSNYKLAKGQTSNNMTDPRAANAVNAQSVAQQPTSNQGAILYESQLQNMIETKGHSWYQANKASIDQAMAEGRYINDLG